MAVQEIGEEAGETGILTGLLCFRGVRTRDEEPSASGDEGGDAFTVFWLRG